LKLVLFRHGDKKLALSSDPDLSPKGLQQSQKLVEDIISKKISKPDVLIVSPRRRTGQTFQKVADHFAIELTTRKELDQQHTHESRSDFRKRIQGFLITLQLDYTDEKTIYLCSHIDWVNEFMSIIETSADITKPQFHNFRSAQWVEFKKNEIWDVMNYGQVNT
jgi:phosphohistidine phosphatase SixA